MQKLSIRKAAEPDEALYELLLLADPSKEIVDDYLVRGECYTAWTSDELAGVFVLLKTRPKTVEIVNIAVKESMHNNGIGRKLIEEAVNKAKQMGAATIEIGTANSSIGQLALYQKCGFRLQAIDHDFFIRHYEEEIFENGIQCRDMIRLYLDL
ncbi:MULTISPECIES: GNAT family N-acetyltransferase [Bacillus]|uniref:GNAT family N-acetyltransferase n=1 Tax=Bacillus TaxID=1386 RepID=UPI0024531EB1|nr:MULTISPECIES: GNAT family N-acetyltransferase [Bacillus]MDH3078839.1 GNAT family N-acetyltransferase [Bacillus amyloliquefaciens]MDU0075293.1 GNAT family N-acetyltransferase [Bacillus sp. IG2]MDU0101938.1 GNAT family N-acetyltransferase [Bacillus sp. IS1]MEC2271059.1 GNAT family N-acetyltransferase [Bacillus velezensis]MED3678792.1 GNAT family N-acetyltransferase [Bacillus velezensis]